MEGNVECGRHPSAVTPAQILQYIEKAYISWIYNDCGVYSIVNKLEMLSDSNDLFKLKRQKNRDNTDNGIKMNEYIAMYSFEFKGTSKLYRKIGCSGNMILNPESYIASASEMNTIIRFPLIQIIMNSMEKYKPKIHSKEGEAIYLNYIRNFILNKVNIVPDVINKQFQLVILK